MWVLLHMHTHWKHSFCKHDTTDTHTVTQPADNTKISSRPLVAEKLLLYLRMCIPQQPFKVFPHKPRHHRSWSKSPRKQLPPKTVSLATSSQRIWLLEQQFLCKKKKKHKEICNWLKHTGNYVSDVTGRLSIGCFRSLPTPTLSTLPHPSLPRHPPLSPSSSV